jgi:hypothetical protein
MNIFNLHDPWFYVIVGGIISFAMIFLPPPLTGSENALFILSSIFQGLATIFGIFFTLILFAAQSASQYSSRVQNRWLSSVRFRAYFLLSFTALILPLYTLQLIPSSDGVLSSKVMLLVKVSMALAACSLVFLIALLVEIGESIKPEIIVNNITSEARDIINKRWAVKGEKTSKVKAVEKFDREILEKTHELKEVAIKSLERGDTSSFYRSIQSIFYLFSAYKAREDEQHVSDYVDWSFAETLCEIYNAPELDPRSAIHSITFLTGKVNQSKEDIKNVRDLLVIIGSKMLISKPGITLNILYALKSLTQNLSASTSKEKSSTEGEEMSLLEDSIARVSYILMLGIWASKVKKSREDEFVTMAKPDFDEWETVEKVERLSFKIVQDFIKLSKTRSIENALDRLIDYAKAYFTVANFPQQVPIYELDIESYRTLLKNDEPPKT